MHLPLQGLERDQQLYDGVTAGAGRACNSRAGGRAPHRAPVAIGVTAGAAGLKPRAAADQVEYLQIRFRLILLLNLVRMDGSRCRGSEDAETGRKIVLREWTPISVRSILIASMITLILGTRLTYTFAPDYYVQRYHEVRQGHLTAMERLACWLERFGRQSAKRC